MSGVAPTTAAVSTRCLRHAARAAMALAVGLGGSPGPGEAQSHARVNGMVFDSLGRSTLAGALVQFVGTSDRTRGLTFGTQTDDEGAYRLDSLPPGAYLAGFFHEAADSMGIDPAPRRVQLRAGVQDIDLATPSPGALRRSLCTGDDSSAVLLGHVRHAETRVVVPGAAAWAEWIETVLDRTSVQTRERADTVTTSQTGFFSICGVPGDVPLLVRVGLGHDSTGYLEVTVPAGEVRHQTFYLGGTRRVSAPAPDSTLAEPEEVVVVRGRSALVGVVEDERGGGVPGARVVLLGAAVEGVANSVGRFFMDSLPAGSWTIEARVIGYSPVRRTVHLTESGPVEVVISLGPRIVTLPTTLIRGELVYSRSLEGFERRRRTQFSGRYITPRDLSTRPLTRLSHLLRGMPGVEVTSRGGFSMVVMKVWPAIPGIDYCTPSLWINGRIDQDGDFDRYHSGDIAAVEVYARGNTRPVEFTERGNCGAVAVWLRPIPTAIRP